MNTAIIMDMMFNTEMIVKDMKGGKEDMTEKRFELLDGIKKGTHSGIWDKQKQNNQRIGDELWIGEVVSMLNEGVMIADENEQLKQQLKTRVIVNKQYEELQRLKKENEQLKEALIELKEIGDYQYASIKELSDENEQLKKEVSDLKQALIRCAFDD